MNSKPRRLRLSPSLVIAMLALFLALGGSAFAAKRYLITNTKQISPAALKAIAKIAAQQGASGNAGARGPEGSPGSAGAAGIPGSAGPAGEPGKPGEPGPRSDILWAVVEPSEGGDPEVINASESTTTVAKVETGTYAVDFHRNVKSCAYESTIGLAGEAGTAFPGFVTVVQQAGNPNSVYVQTFDKDGVSSDLGFHLTVFC